MYSNDVKFYSELNKFIENKPYDFSEFGTKGLHKYFTHYGIPIKSKSHSVDINPSCIVWDSPRVGVSKYEESYSIFNDPMYLPNFNEVNQARDKFEYSLEERNPEIVRMEEFCKKECDFIGNNSYWFETGIFRDYGKKICFKKKNKCYCEVSNKYFHTLPQLIDT